MNTKEPLSIKEVAQELMKAIQPAIEKSREELQTQIDTLEEKVKILDSKIQSISSVIINKRKHTRK